MFSTFVAQSASEYSTTYTIPSGTEDTSNCGQYTLSNFLLLQGGLNAKYYTNRWFSGDAYLETQDSEINFNWGDGELITDVASDYVSIIWSGFL